MPRLTVVTDAGEAIITFAEGRTVRQILDGSAIRIRSGCRGLGACGLCRVRIEEGQAGEPTQNELLLLDPAQRAAGVRLACQARPRGDIRLSLLSPSPQPLWHPLEPAAETSGAAEPASAKGRPYGVAVDLGTTNIRLGLHDVSDGRRLAGLASANPQVAFGSDVVSRLVAASESPRQAQVLQQLALEAIGTGLWNLTTSRGLDPARVSRVALVGNTAMLTLLSGQDPTALLDPARWAEPVACRPPDASAWAALWGLAPGARIEVVPPLGGFIGSDLPAGVLATGLLDSGPGSLLIDFGTNTEIALWDGATLWATSAAGGPAFEGSGMSSGMPAEPGAVYRLRLRGETLDLAVIAGGEPRGLCGSGLVDLVAALVASGRLSRRGRFTPPLPAEGLVLARGGATVTVTRADVDLFQRAKAAVGAGIQALLELAGLSGARLRRVGVGGAFGRFLDVASAQAVGLLPGCPAERVELCGDTALAGCAKVLCSPDESAVLPRLAGRVKVVNLARHPGFDELFLDNLHLEPIQEMADDPRMATSG